MVREAGHLRGLCWGRRSSPGLFVLPCAMLVTACADLVGEATMRHDDADYWDTALVYSQHIDTLMMSGSAAEPLTSGMVSAVAASGDALYFIDFGTRRLVEASLMDRTLHSIAALDSPTASGLHADLDDVVYAIDQAHRDVRIIDKLIGEIRRYSLPSAMHNPIDLAVLQQGQRLAVLDGMTGRIALLDTFGGLTRMLQPEPPGAAYFVKPSAIASMGDDLLVLDGGADQVVGISLNGRVTGVFAADDLQQASAMAADSCGRFFVADALAGTLYMGIADMSLPGRRINVPELAASEVTDLWTDDVFVYAATRTDGIHILLIDPGCTVQ